MENIYIKKIALRFIFIFFLIPLISSAEEAVSPLGFAIEPSVSHVSVIRGGQFRSGFTVRNIGTKPIAFTVRVADFEQNSEYGGIKEIDTSIDKYDQIKAAGWFSFPSERIVISVNQKIVVPYSILVPDDASFGGRSVVFIVESVDGNVHSQINALCFLTVPGDAKESVEFINFSFSPIVTSKAEGSVHIELKNTGKTHLRPEGRVVVRNMFGAIRGSFPLVEKESIGTIIPSAKRSVDYAWSGSLNAFDFGLWNMRLELQYGIGGSNSIADRAFFLVLPWKALLLTLIIIGGSIYFFIFSMKRLRREMKDLEDKHLSEAENAISVRLLIIPFIAGLLLLCVTVFTMYSVLETKGEGSINKIQINKI